ncbi:hypothetical protein FA13DRAFT_1731678 [Coprinellus micaceus]|uniref:Uncharacterized protein n=1 Tax=Coprinellus micaceus TaxID=71717 RepID=A0A4Y7TE69_COPMI|nr:hypothetical protein FA13DRAFT_1731678 [Coprinellus micaceus]
MGHTTIWLRWHKLSSRFFAEDSISRWYAAKSIVHYSPVVKQLSSSRTSGPGVPAHLHRSLSLIQIFGKGRAPFLSQIGASPSRTLNGRP